MQTHLYECKHCRKRFMKEGAFMAHECKEMLRSREIQSMQGQQAYQLYKLWLEKQRRKPPTIEVFITSTYYTSFYKFAGHARELGISDPDLFVQLMVGQGISPALWTRGDCYDLFIEHLDKKSDPYRQAENTLKELMGIAEKLDCSIGDVFGKLHYGEIMTLLNQHKLSPWILFCSGRFKERLAAFDEAEKTNLLRTIGATYWAHKLEEKPAVVQDMKHLVSEVGL